MESTSWKHHDGTRFPKRVYDRPLGLTELGFYWDKQFNGTADCFQSATVETAHASVFSEDNVKRAWISLKQTYPLLGSRVERPKDGSEGMLFVIEEEKLNFCRPNEIHFRSISAPDDDTALIKDLMKGGPWLLSDDCLAHVFILVRTDRPNTFHVLTHVAHCVTDGMANLTLLRYLLDALCRPSSPAPPLENRLRISVSSEELVPSLKMSIPRQRWRRAIGSVLGTIQLANFEGGHTLPRKFTTTTSDTAAKSASAVSSISVETSAHIFQNCRRNHITFGQALPVIAQVALARLLCRRYLRGEIGEEEWNYRRREPMVTGGPLNLRPFLDQEWYKNGGASNVCVSIGFFFYTLPFMPLGEASRLPVGSNLPQVGAFLTPERFFLRCNMISKQSKRLMKNPLFLEISGSRGAGRVERVRNGALRWQEAQKNGGPLLGQDIPVPEQALNAAVLTHTGSSFGNTDAMLPLNYPLTPVADEPILRLQSNRTHLQCRPTELYLGASTSHGQLQFAIYWDSNVYDDATVHEWLLEVESAVEWYLGRPRVDAKL